LFIDDIGGSTIWFIGGSTIWFIDDIGGNTIWFIDGSTIWFIDDIGGSSDDIGRSLVTGDNISIFLFLHSLH
jgi:hypothetical protein